MTTYKMRRTAIGQSLTGIITSSRTRSARLSIWVATCVFAVSLLLVVFLFWRAYDQKRRAGMSVEQASDRPRQYSKVAIADIAANHYTHIEITGKVTSLRQEKDGDMHIHVSDGAEFIVGECIPKLPCSVIPDVGQTVTVRGISRYDRENHWYEVHPVEEIEVKK